LGYDNLPSVLPKLNKDGKLHKRLYYENKIKNILFENSFSEIYTYTFGNSGVVEIVQGLASDKEKLRTNLKDGVLKAIQMNLNNAPVLSLNTIKVFEFGNIFDNNLNDKSTKYGFWLFESREKPPENTGFIFVSKTVDWERYNWLRENIYLEKILENDEVILYKVKN
jgi:phenylalanyl-tRNA synthetase beta subunit